MFQIIKRDNLTKARVGKIETAHGFFETPSLFIKTKKNQIKFIQPEEYKSLKIQSIEADAYIIFELIGEEGLASTNGIFDILKYKCPVITSSGSEYLFSLKFKINNSGINFENLQKGVEDYFDAELSIKIQQELQSDIISAFHIPILPQYNYEKAKILFENSLNWQMRSLEAKNSNQEIYGIIDCGKFEDLIEQNTKFLSKLSFDGFQIGNRLNHLDFNSLKNIISKMNQNLEEEKPKHFSEFVSLEEIFFLVESGMDTFSFYPDFWSKKGIAWNNSGKINLKEKLDTLILNSPIEEFCNCPVCSAEIKIKDLIDLLNKKSNDFYRFLNVHNIYFLNNLMELIRESISNGEFQKLKEYFLKTKML
jgi:queuine tRNA-ribosyltransferase